MASLNLIRHSMRHSFNTSVAGTSLKEGGYVFISVCLSVCLSVC